MVFCEIPCGQKEEIAWVAVRMGVPRDSFSLSYLVLYTCYDMVMCRYLL